MIRNAVTIDVEDWYHVCGVGEIPPIHHDRFRVAVATRRVLSLLDEFGIKATFFVLGKVAEAEPALIEQVAAGGHEIASHGWSHSLVHDLTPDQFREELERTELQLEKLTGVRPVGFRAPQWSVSPRTSWVHGILAERGYRYDSSITPLALIGDPEGSRVPYRVPTSGGPVWEFPPLVTPTRFGNLPTGGGWGFRFFPTRIIEGTLKRLNAAGHPGVLYLHPRDADPLGPRLRLSPLMRFAAYGLRNDALPRLRRLLEAFRFTTLKELVADDVLYPDPVL